MPSGLRIDPTEFDLDGFRAFVAAAGAVHDEPKNAAAEVLRFRVGVAFGTVSRRKDGTLTFTGVAKPLLRQMLGGDPPARPRVKITIRTVTIRAEAHAEARELLKDARKAEVHTDGSCERGGLGKGGWAAIIRSGLVNVEIYGGARSTTVNRMEMAAAIAALELLPAGCRVKLFTDSQYLRKGISQWIVGWKRRGWITVSGSAVKNVDLWHRLDTAREPHIVTWKWVRGHSGNRSNERADELARQSRLTVNSNGC